MIFVRVIAVCLIFFAGIGFGMFGVADPLNFEKAASFLALIAGVALLVWEGLEAL